MAYRYFKGNVLGGFRLADLEKDVRQGQFIFLDEHIANTSRAVAAALKQRWMLEVTAAEATIPATSAGTIAMPQAGTPTPAQAPQNESKVALPNVAAVNEKLKKRGDEEVKVAIPNIKEVEKKNQEKRDEIAKQPADQTLAAPRRASEVVKTEVKTTVSALAKEDSIIPGIDNSLLSTPVIPKEATKEPVTEEIPKRRRRRKSSTEES